MEAEHMARIARAVAHPTRIRILRLLAGEANCCGSELFSEMRLPQSTVSQHLAVLKDAGLVSATARGTGQVYCVTPHPLLEVIAEFGRLVDGHPECAGEEAV